jgi:transposase-like protein
MAAPKDDGLRKRATELGLRLGVRTAAARLAGQVSKSTLAEWVRAARQARAAGVSGRPGGIDAPKAPEARQSAPAPAKAAGESSPLPRASGARAKAGLAMLFHEAFTDKLPPLSPERLAQGGAETSEDAPAGGLVDELAGVDVYALDFSVLEVLEAEVAKERTTAREGGDTRQYVQLARLQIDLRGAMAKLRPPPKVDAAVDPANLEAREIVLKRLAKMVVNAREASVIAAKRAAKGAGEDDE